MKEYLSQKFKDNVDAKAIEKFEGRYKEIKFYLQCGITKDEKELLSHMRVFRINGNTTEILRSRLLTYDVDDIDVAKDDVLNMLHTDISNFTIDYDHFGDDEYFDKAAEISMAICQSKWEFLIEKEEHKIERINKICKDVLEDKSLSFDNRLRTLIMHFTAELNKIKGDGIVVSNESILSGSEE